MRLRIGGMTPYVIPVGGLPWLARFGGGIFLDGPWRGRHVDTRLGWSPPNAGQPQQVSVFVALGQVWD